MGALSTLWEKGFCVRCKRQREAGNDTFWCVSCTAKDRLSHTEALSK